MNEKTEHHFRDAGNMVDEELPLDALTASSAIVLAREALMAFGAEFAKSELAGVQNPIPINNLIGRFSRGAIEALEKAFAETCSNQTHGNDD